jgi:UDP-N-acetylglucosamine--N-acetylmuramyl-(pentapeptide) pyrophosphoryl-undecaprenol N-acetylglucosamine transferase
MNNRPKIKIVLTGGGTAGHVMPHLPLISLMQEKDWEVYYIGSDGFEKDVIKGLGVDFFSIRTGKWRRYASFQNYLDLFNVLIGFFQSIYFLSIIKPHVVFSKGGFVSLPVAIAAWFLRIPVATHESDITPGLANKVIARVAKRIMYSFPETKNYIPAHKAELTGIPIRRNLLDGDKNRALTLCGFSSEDSRPIVLIMGGSQGSNIINEFVEQACKHLILKYRVMHLTGKGKKLNLNSPGSYWQKEYVNLQLKDLLKAADVVVSRAGANSLFELLTLRKKMLLVPLSKGTRGDQILNARSFSNQGWASVVLEKDLSIKSFMETLDALVLEDFSKERDLLFIESFLKKDSSSEVVKLLQELATV